MPQTPSQKATLTIIASLIVAVVIGLATMQILASPDYKPSKFLGINKFIENSSSNSSSSLSVSSSSPVDIQKNQSSSSSIQSSSNSDSNNAQNSSSISSTTNSSSSQSQSSSSSQSAAPKATKTYTNQYFPDLKLAYPEDWKMETKTEPAESYQNLVQRTVTLTKNQSKLIFYTTPLLLGTGCADIDGKPYVATTGSFYRFKEDNNKYNYSKIDFGGECGQLIGNELTSNIKSSDIKVNPKSPYNTQKQIDEVYKKYGPFAIYNYSLTLTSTNPSEIQEVDQIVANSVFK